VSGLVDKGQERSKGQVWLQRSAYALGMAAVVALIAWMGFSLNHSSPGPKRQVAKLALLPDTPPPPPPPPPPEKPRIEPKNEIKQQNDKPKQETPPEPQQLKMEGAAGEGPSPFAAGEVKNEYIGGDVGNGARFAAYVGHVAQFVQESLAKRNLRAANARIFLWLSADGAVQRYEINGASGDLERQLRSVMAEMARVPEAPPQDMPMPMGLEISDR
jgi:periplasmic protein TonB